MKFLVTINTIVIVFLKKGDSNTLKIFNIHIPTSYLQNDNVLFFETRIILYKRILNFIHNHHF